MLKTSLLLLLFFMAFHSFSQCLTALSPPACSGTEPLVTDGEILTKGNTKWYYGSTITMSSLTLQGGVLVVCGDLTIDKFYMDSGTVFIRPGARFVIGSGIGSGLEFKGSCAIYNYGTCEIWRNLSLENNANAASPNIVINATSASLFKMSNQYFVINNNYSWFVNNGRAEFWGIITDVQSAAGSVCLGNGSTTKMAILINKVNNTYVAPGGNACVYVFQLSEFYGQLTSSPTIFVCLASGHTSSTSCIPFGCHPNDWGAAQVFTNCSGCGAITVLPVRFISFTASRNQNGNHELQWQINSDIHEGMFYILRSTDGLTYYAMDSLFIHENTPPVFNSIDKHPLPGKNYYMIRYTNPHTGMMTHSKIAMLLPEITVGFNLYPVPFEDKFFITCEPGVYPQKILLTDISGRNIRTRYFIRDGESSAEVVVLDKLQAGLYIIHMQTNKSLVAKTIFKR
ncbi:MAG: T9SS type A sorting domain-containing protein [Bacteroidota bacterium]|nr:T9SS type A sorting domain-containing protein [Bacteroidota bacterium]